MIHVAFYVKKTLHLTLHCVVWFVSLLYSIGKKKKLPPIQNPILLKSASELAEEIRKRKLKSVEVIQAFIQRIEEVEPYINAVVQDRFKDALAEAKQADTLIESGVYTERVLEKEKPLLGVPFTVKVLLTVKGFRATAGSLILKDEIGKEDAPSVTLLRKAGGIILATTNCSEMGSTIESNNFVHGRTNNPYDTSRTSGGSSGGESALLGASASVIGLGNDVLGSIRIPCHFCCLFGHKPSIGMVPNGGSMPKPHPSSEYFLCTGPMCRYAEDLVLTMRLLSLESKVKFVPRDQVDFSKLKVYYQIELDNPWIPKPDRDIVEAVKNAASYFTKTYGSVSKEVDIPDLNKANSIAIHLLHGEIRNIVEHTTLGKKKHINGFLELFKALFGLSKWTLMVIIAGGFGKCFILFNKQLMSFYKKLRSNLIENFEELLDENSVFLYPTLPVAARHHFGVISYAFSIAYTNVFNFTGMPATQCPMGLNRNGLPIGIQIAGRRNNDALTIACAMELEKAFGGWIPPDKVQN